MKKADLIISAIIATSLFFGSTTLTSGIAQAENSDEKLDIYLASPTEWTNQRKILFEARQQQLPIGEGGGIGAINTYQSSYREYVETAIRQAKENPVYGEVIVPKEGQDYLNAHGAAIQSERYPRQNIEILPDTGKDSVDTPIMTGTAGVLIIAGTVLTFRKRLK